MSSIKSNYPITWMNLEKLNRRIPKSVEKKQEGFAKRFRKTKADPFESLAKLYRYFDEVAGYMDGLTACKKGCGHCCHMEIALSQLEADFIAAKTGFNALHPSP